METHDDALRVEVRRALELVGDAAVPSRGFDQLPVPPVVEPSPRRLGLILVGVAAIVVLVAGLVWVASVRGPDDDVPAGPERGDLPAEWVKVAPSSLSPRTNTVVAWTGAHVLVAGGDTRLCGPTGHLCRDPVELFTDGALYDPRTDSWTRIADAPAAIGAGETATVPGTVYVLTTAPLDSATASPRALYSYSINDDAWERIALPSNADNWGLEAVGTTIVLYSGDDEFQREADYLLAPDTGTWEPLPDDPLPLSYGRRMVWNGTELYLFAHELRGNPGAERRPPVLLAAYDFDSGEWRRLPEGAGVGVGPLVEGDQLIWINPQFGCGDGREPCLPRGRVFDTVSETWSLVPDVPDAEQRAVHLSGAIGEASSLVYGQGGFLFDVEYQRWVEMPALPNGDTDDDAAFERRIHPVGADAFVFGGAGYDGADGALLDEAWIWRTARNERWWQPTDLPAGYELTSSFTNPDGLLRVQEYTNADDGRAIRVWNSTLPIGLPKAIGETRIGSTTWQIAQSVRNDQVQWTTLFRTDGRNEWLVNGEGLDVADLERIVASLEPRAELGAAPDESFVPAVPTASDSIVASSTIQPGVSP